MSRVPTASEQDIGDAHRGSSVVAQQVIAAAATTTGSPLEVCSDASDGHAHQIASAELATLYQPIVSLERREIVGFHSFAQAPDELGGSTSDELRALAHSAGRTADWDWRYRAATFEGALAADLPAALSVFVGIEPETLDVPCPATLAGLLAKAEAQLRIFVEFDGPTLLANPSGLLSAIERAREARWGVVLRGLAHHPSSAAILRLIYPDVVAFDLARLRTLSIEVAARVVNDCMTYCQESGASLLVRAVDSPADLNQALAWRADFAQGQLFGAPTTTLDSTKPPRRAVPLIGTTSPAVAVDPFDEISAVGNVWQFPPRRLALLLRTLEQRCLSLSQAAVVLCCQYRGLFNGDHGAIDAETLGARTSFMGMLATRPSANPPSTAVRVRLSRQDPLAEQRILVIIGDHFSVALAARRGDRSIGDDRIDVALCYDPVTVTSVARLLLSRIPAVPADDGRILRAVPPRVSAASVQATTSDQLAPPTSGMRRFLGRRTRA